MWISIPKAIDVGCFSLGDRITLQGDIYPGNIELTVRGIYDAPVNNEALYFNREYVFEGLPEARKGQIGQFAILADNAESVPRFGERRGVGFGHRRRAGDVRCRSHKDRGKRRRQDSPGGERD